MNNPQKIVYRQIVVAVENGTCPICKDHLDDCNGLVSIYLPGKPMRNRVVSAPLLFCPSCNICEISQYQEEELLKNYGGTVFRVPDSKKLRLQDAQSCVRKLPTEQQVKRQRRFLSSISKYTAKKNRDNDNPREIEIADELHQIRGAEKYN